MIDLFLKLLGIHVTQASRLSGWSVTTRGGIWIGWLVIGAIGVTAAVFLLYRRSASHVGRLRWWTLAGLRAAFLVLLLMMLARPVVRLTIQGSVRRSMQILVDESQSMAIPDLRNSEADIKRAAIARDILDPSRGLDQTLDAGKAESVSQIPRVEMIHAVLKNPHMDLLRRLRSFFSVQPFGFGEYLHDIAETAGNAAPAGSDKATSVEDTTNAWVDTLNAKEPLTRLGDAISDVLAKTRGQSSAGILVITDGQSNSGRSLVAAAEQAKIENVPIYVYGVGISQPRDIVVANLFTRDVAFVDDELPVSVRVRSPGLAGESATINLMLDNQVVDTQQITFDPSGEQVVTMHFTPAEKGKYTLKARIEPRPDEASKDNNEASQPLKIIDDKIKVLYVEQSPRWEFKYLMAMLIRDRRVNFKALLLEADSETTLDENGPFLRQFPADAQALTKFDLIILGDVDPNLFTQAQTDAISRWVREGGGGFLSIAGRRYNPWGYIGTKIADTKIADLLPVDIAERAGIDTPPPQASDRPIQLQLTPAGQENPMMRLTDDPRESQLIWARLPPIYWDSPIYRAKPGAQVLLADPDPAKENRFGLMPVMVLSQTGLGQVMFMGTDNTWRWRKNEGEAYHTALWGQIIQRLSLPHLLGGSKKTQISTDKEKYTVGEKVTVMARLYDDSLKPIDDPEVKALYQRKDTAATPLILRLAGSEKGIYRGEMVVPAPGDYQTWVERDEKTRRDFSAVQVQVELTETAMNESGLKDLAASTGGQFFREENLYQLPDVLLRKTETVQRTEEVEIWSTWGYFLLVLLIVTLEWILRKVVMLK